MNGGGSIDGDDGTGSDRGMRKAEEGKDERREEKKGGRVQLANEKLKRGPGAVDSSG